jgi:hypothetical protein
VTEKVRVNANRVLEMVSLVCNKNAATIKLKETVSKNTTSVEEIVYLGDDERGCEAATYVGGESLEGGLDGVPEGKVNIAEGEVEARVDETGVGADSDGGDVEEAGPEEVSGSDERGVMGVSLEGEDRRESRGRVNQFSLSREL